MSTIVIFRKFKDSGDIIALFPEEIADYNGNCSSYTHVGQHGAANYKHCIDITKGVSLYREYKSLLEELVKVGYDDLVIKTRITFKKKKKKKKKKKEKV